MPFLPKLGLFRKKQVIADYKRGKPADEHRHHFSIHEEARLTGGNVTVSMMNPKRRVRAAFGTTDEVPGAKHLGTITRGPEKIHWYEDRRFRGLRHEKGKA